MKGFGGRTGSFARALLAALLGFGALGSQALAQDGEKAAPFENTEPGQTPQQNSADPKRGLSLGVLHWAPIESECGFTGGSDAVPVMRTEETQPLVFVTMATPGASGPARIERGYIMANGIVRELERGKSAPNREGTVTTLWRSAGEPRINVSVAINETKETEGNTEYDGSMTVHWGDKKETVEIQGRCLEGSNGQKNG